jgi:hypothetical protein
MREAVCLFDCFQLSRETATYVYTMVRNPDPAAGRKQFTTNLPAADICGSNSRDAVPTGISSSSSQL